MGKAPGMKRSSFLIRAPQVADDLRAEPSVPVMGFAGAANDYSRATAGGRELASGFADQTDSNVAMPEPVFGPRHSGERPEDELQGKLRENPEDWQIAGAALARPVPQ